MTTFGHGSLDRLTTVTADAGGIGAVTSYAHDAVGNRTAITDARSHATDFGYDCLDRLLWERDACGKCEYYAYDPVGNLVELSDWDGQTTYYAYDALGRQEQIDFPEGYSAYFACDAIGNLTSASDDYEADAYVYDELDRLTERTITGVGTLYFAYDLAGRRTMVQDWTGAATYYTYDGRGLITEVHSAAGWTYYSYDARGAMLVKELPNGTVTYHSYDAAGRVTAVEDRKTDGTAITTFAFTRDPNANILTSLREDGSCWYYAYDGMQRLTKAEWKDGASLLYGYQYNYDKVGNRLSLLADGTVGCYSYNNCNELTDELCGSEEVDYDYDGRGNCVSRSVEGGATTYFEYNARNLVTRIDTTEPGFVPNVFTYNALGQRISKTDSTGTTYYVWDGLHILLEHDGAGTITRRYTYGHEAIHGVSGLIHVEDVSGDAHYFYHFDQVGGVRAVTTEAAATDTTYAYSPFGRILEESAGSAPNDFTFPATYIKLPDIGCLRLSPSRLCDTKVGRYMSRDPQRLVPTYPALQSNPLRLADPSGRDFLQALQDVAQVAGAFLEAVPQTWASGEAFDAWSGSVTSLFGIEGEAFYGNDAAYQLGEENPEIAGVAVTATAAAVSLMGVQAGTGFRIEIHGTHGWCWPHFQGIQGPGYGTTLGRFPPHTWPWPPWAGP